MTDLDLFSCAGGATTGLAMLGRTVVGIDHDPDACRTHLAAGHPTIRADLTAPVPVSGPFDMVWASPPCTAFSMAGKGAGRDVADVLIGRILAENWEPLPDLDPSVWLILPTMRTLLELGPTAVAMENVPPTLPVMHACAQVLERHGWHTAVGVLSAERFGVAQTRKRAFLIANRERTVQMPEPTHQGYEFGQPAQAEHTLFGELLPWMSMADALGWGSPDRPYFTVAPGTDQGGMDPVGGSGARTSLGELAARPSWVPPAALDRRCQQGPESARESVPVVSIDRPAPSITGVRGQFVWVYDRPATTIAGDSRVFQPGGHHEQGQQSENAITVTVDEVARLQAFPAGHPWYGNKSSAHRQVGNAVPPPVAAAVAGAALGIDWRPAVSDYLAELYSQPLEREVAA